MVYVTLLLFCDDGMSSKKQGKPSSLYIVQWLKVFAMQKKRDTKNNKLQKFESKCWQRKLLSATKIYNYLPVTIFVPLNHS